MQNLFFITYSNSTQKWKVKIKHCYRWWNAAFDTQAKAHRKPKFFLRKFSQFTWSVCGQFKRTDSVFVQNIPNAPSYEFTTQSSYLCYDRPPRRGISASFSPLAWIVSSPAPSRPTSRITLLKSCVQCGASHSLSAVFTGSVQIDLASANCRKLRSRPRTWFLSKLFTSRVDSFESRAVKTNESDNTDQILCPMRSFTFSQRGIHWLGPDRPGICKLPKTSQQTTQLLEGCISVWAPGD